MSIPIKYCLLVEAVDSAETFVKLHPVMKRNIESGHFSIWPCNHEPPCRALTDVEYEDLMQRFKEPCMGAGKAEEKGGRCP